MPLTQKAPFPPFGARKKVIQVLIVDDHPIVREGLALRVSLESDMHICAQADNVGDALRLAEVTRPDVAVIDVTLKTGNGIDLIKQLKDRGGPMRMVVWSMHGEDLYAERALRAGAIGYINKAEATDRLIDAIRKAFDNKICVSPKLAETLLGRSVGPPNSAVGNIPVELLSDREFEVFQLLAEEFDIRQIADRMGVRPKTVETYCSRIKEKLHLSTARELLSRAVQWRMKNV
jgi:DNA-binding NarL/FixJ family response regulator